MSGNDLVLEIEGCTSLYQFLTTNWCCIFTAQLLPGRKLASKSTFQGLLFMFSSITNIFYFSPNLCENVFWLATIFNNNVLICCQSTIFNSYQKFLALPYKAQAFNYFIKCGIQIHLHFTIESKYILHAFCFWNFFSSMPLIFTLYLFLLSALKQ